ncbi:MAG: hypothetical protein U0R64_04330 [Candidatus Nanopelagicales bacterium]
MASIVVVGASAASLGTITPQTLGASTAVVAACQSSGLGVTWGTVAYSASGPSETVGGGTITGVAAGCQSKSYRIDVSTGAAASLANATGTTAASATTTFTLSAAVDASTITQVTLIIYG